jgi:hypothetical protein
MVRKTTIRYSLIIFTLGLFSSCAEQFREIGGSENGGNAFFGTGIAKSTATKRTDKTKGERVMPQQTVIPVEQVATEIVAENSPNRNPIEPKIEKTETNPTSVITGQKGSVSEKNKGSSTRILKKTKLSNPVKILKKALSQRDNGDEVNGWLVALGILGLISSILGILIVLIAAIFESSSILMGILGVDAPLLVDFFLFLLGLISSIWIIASPTLEDANGLKIAAVVIAALPLLMILIYLMGLLLLNY